MDFRNVAGLTIPAGSVNKISIGGVVIWQKASAPKYGVYKDDVLIEEVTMDDFVDKVESGYAEENWGIGAQLRVPYTDAWDGITYTLPWDFVHFGSFTVNNVTHPQIFLQAHYAVPSCTVPYGLDTLATDYKSMIRNSDIYKWLISNDTNFSSTESTYKGKKGFKACLPQDFSERLKLYFFPIPSAYQCYASHDKLRQNSDNYLDNYEFSTGISDTFSLTFWENKIGTRQAFNTINNERIVYSITGTQTNVAIATVMAHRVQQTSQSKTNWTYYSTYFTTTGKYTYGTAKQSSRYQPLFALYIDF